MIYEKIPDSHFKTAVERRVIMCDPEKHPFFEKYRDKESCVESYILTEKVAPLQKNFYFINNGMTPNEDYLWFLCAFPPANYMVLGVVSLDAQKPFIKCFPNAQFTCESPMVSHDGKGVYYAGKREIYYIEPTGNIKKIG